MLVAGTGNSYGRRFGQYAKWRWFIGWFPVPAVLPVPPLSIPTPLPPISKIGDRIVQTRLPMTGNPMRYINGYLLEDDDGLILIDCGWKADDVRAALDEGLALCGYTVRDLKRLLVTHFHFDHY